MGAESDDERDSMSLVTSHLRPCVKRDERYPRTG